MGQNIICLLCYRLVQEAVTGRPWNILVVWLEGKCYKCQGQYACFLGILNHKSLDPCQAVKSTPPADHQTYKHKSFRAVALPWLHNVLHWGGAGESQNIGEACKAELGHLTGVLGMDVCVPLSLCLSVPLYRCTSVPMRICTYVLLYLCTSVPLYLCSSVTLYLFKIVGLNKEINCMRFSYKGRQGGQQRACSTGRAESKN